MHDRAVWPGDGRHETGLFPGQGLGVGRIVRQQPVGTSPAQGLQVVGHRLTSSVTRSEGYIGGCVPALGQCGQPGPAAAEAGAHRPHRYAEGQGYLVVAQLLPGEEQEDLPFGLGKGPDGVHDAGPPGAGVSRRHRSLRRILVQQPSGGDPGHGPGPPGLAPVVLGHHVGGDAVQPGPGRVPVPVEGRPPLEGDPEHLSQQVLGLSRVDAAGQETQERRSVPVEDDTEGSPASPANRRSRHRLTPPC